MDITLKKTFYFYLLIHLTPLNSAYATGYTKNKINSQYDIKFSTINNTADEIVFGDRYNDRNGKVSHLIWCTYSSPVLEAKISSSSKQSKGSITFEFGYGGDHHMADYDYLWPTLENGHSNEIVNYDWQNQYEWTHLSTHPNTKMTHYFKGQYDFELFPFKKNNLTLSTLIGCSLLNTGWAAYGGSYKYWDETVSNDGQGGYIMNFDEGTLENKKGGSFRIRIYSVLVGCKAVFNIDKNQLHFQALAGPSLPKMTDHHYLRNFYGYSAFNPSMFYSFQCSLNRNIKENIFLVCQAEYSTLPVTKDIFIATDTATEEITYADGFALRFRSKKLSLGICYIM